MSTASCLLTPVLSHDDDDDGGGDDDNDDDDGDDDDDNDDAVSYTHLTLPTNREV